MSKQSESDARYKAREQWREEAVFNNPYEKGSIESLAFLSEAHKIKFEMDESL